MTRSRAVSAALCLVSVLAFGACSGDDPEPRFAPPSTSAPSSPSTTAVSGPVEPTLPAAAEGTDAAAAEAFVEFYWEMVNYAQATGDVDGLKRLATKCVNCDNGVHSIEAAYRHGGNIRGGVGSVDRLKTNFINRDGVWWAVVEGRLSLTRQVVVHASPASVKRYPGGVNAIRMYLQPSSGAWTVRSVGNQ